MKVSNNNPNVNSSYSHEVIKPKSIKKININLFETYDNYFPESLNFPENLSEKEIEILKEKNKKFFNEYLEKWEENSLLKYKLQDLLNKKNEIHKYLIQLEHKKERNIIENENNITFINNNSNLINKELLNFKSNIYINRKRKRRKKSEITCKFECLDCNKKYATEGALNQHKKLKHNDQ